MGLIFQGCFFFFLLVFFGMKPDTLRSAAVPCMEWSRGWWSPDGPAASKRWQLNVKQMCDENLHMPLPQRLTNKHVAID